METVGDMLKRYEAEEMGHLAPRTLRDYKRNLEILHAKFGHFVIAELKPKDIGLFIDNSKTGRIQRAKIVSILSNVYTLAVGQWWVADHNPCRDVRKPKSRARTRYITDAEFKAVYDIAPAPIQIMMDLALLTGQRQGDLVNLGWDQVDVLERVIHFTQSKTQRKLAVRISPALEAVLVRAKRRLPALPRLYVVRTRSGLPYSECGMRTSWQRVMNQAMRDGLIKTRYTFHDIRAKSASDSGTIEQAYERLGHQSMGITRSIYDRGERIVEPLR